MEIDFFASVCTFSPSRDGACCSGSGCPWVVASLGRMVVVVSISGRSGFSCGTGAAGAGAVGLAPVRDLAFVFAPLQTAAAEGQPS